MGWALTMEGRRDPGGAMILFDDRLEAEDLARQIRARGTRVVVKPYPDDAGRVRESAVTLEG
jgi:hypothetical protein